MIPKAYSAGLRDLGHRRRPLCTRRILVGLQSSERISRQLRVVLRHVAKKLEKERERPRRVLMLQRTMLR